MTSVEEKEAPEAVLDALNEAQLAAVTSGDGPMLILAGAGTGKTRVITRRIVWLLTTGRARPHEILAITFTNKAAREMRERVEAFFPVKGMWISTFHAMCARMLRREIEVLGSWTRDFTIYDTHDKNQLLKRITKDLGYDVQRFRPGMLSAWISDWKSERFRGEQESEEIGRGMEEQVFVQVRDRYEAALRASNALDFDDLLVKTLEILQAHPGIRDNYASRFRYVLVDEYQDTNRIQYLLAKHLSSWHKNLAVCGDPDQSIYAWRGADIRNILDFEADFGLERDAVQVVKLERNYRSTECILAAAQSLIRHNRERKEKDLWTEKKTPTLIRVLECSDENDEANEIALQVHALREKGFAPDQIAVFYRVNFMQRALERAMRLSGIPYQIVGGLEFYARREIRDLLAYLNLIVNPRDDVSCRRVINVPARGIGETSLERLGAWAVERGTTLLQAAGSDEARATIRGRAKAGLKAFAQLFEHLSDLADGPALRALDAVLEETEYVSWLATGGEDVQNREENIDELRAHAETFDAENPEGGLRGFLQEVALVSDVDTWDEGGPKVTLMTMHASKGLEFPVVFIAGVEEELLPHALALSDPDSEEGGVEEERRLFYVGMTRAQDELFMTHARMRFHFGESSWRLPSRFLAEIPDELVEGAAEDEDDVLGVYEAPEEIDVPELRVGDRVEHDHFGYGYVERLQGAGINARVTVDFTSVGNKVLLLQYAKLRVVEK